jgi:hypothetical protein
MYVCCPFVSINNWISFQALKHVFEHFSAHYLIVDGLYEHGYYREAMDTIENSIKAPGVIFQNVLSVVFKACLHRLVMIRDRQQLRLFFILFFVPGPRKRRLSPHETVGQISQVATGEKRFSHVHPHGSAHGIDDY